MEKITFKNSDLEMSRLIYGCMTLSSWDKNPISDSEIKNAENIINVNLENGINSFDHADIYCFGKSELVFGEILKNQSNLRDKIIIQSKCGIRFQDDPEPGLPGRYDFSYDYIISSTENILKRLNTDYLDILLLHRPDSLMEPEEVSKAFDVLQKSGKVKYFGVSNFNKEQIEFLQKYLDQKILINQIEFNLLHSGLINDGVIANINSGNNSNVAGLLDYCRLNEIQIQAYSPLAKGLFSRLPEGQEEKIYRTADYLKELCSKYKLPEEAILLAWISRHPAKIQSVVGTGNIERIKNCILSEKINLTREEWYKLFVLARGEVLP